MLSSKRKVNCSLFECFPYQFSLFQQAKKFSLRIQMCRECGFEAASNKGMKQHFNSSNCKKRQRTRWDVKTTVGHVLAMRDRKVVNFFGKRDKNRHSFKVSHETIFQKSHLLPHSEGQFRGICFVKVSIVLNLKTHILKWEIKMKNCYLPFVCHGISDQLLSSSCND